MSQPATFTQDGAKRIVNAVRQWEQDNGQVSERQPVSKPATPPVMLVKTPSSLPGGYTGSTALDGTVVEWVTGTAAFTTIASSVWIKSLNGESLAAGTVYNARFNGTYAQSGTTKSLFLVEASSSGLSSNYIGETCHGYYNGGSRVTTGGAFGYGYTEVSVPVGASTTPYSTLETWRLHHGAEPNTTFGPWAANQYQPISGWTLPTMPTTTVGGISVSNRLRFHGKRGDLVSGTTYNCYQYSLLSFSIGGTVRLNNGTGYFSIYGQTDLYFESYQQTPTLGSSGSLFAWTNKWDALYNGSATGFQYANMAWSQAQRGDETLKALIGFDQDIGWHIRAVDCSDYRIQGKNKNTTGV